MRKHRTRTLALPLIPDIISHKFGTSWLTIHVLQMQMIAIGGAIGSIPSNSSIGHSTDLTTTQALVCSSVQVLPSPMAVQHP